MPHACDKEPFGYLFAALLDEVGADRIRALIVGQWGDQIINDVPVDLLAQAAERLVHLEALFLAEMTFRECEISWIQLGDVTPLLIAYPRVKALRVRGSAGLQLTPVRHEALRELAFESGGLPPDVVRAVGACDLPALEHLELWLGSSEYGEIAQLDDLTGVLSGERFPQLRYLGLRDAEIADEVAAAVVASPVLGRLEHLDLSLGGATRAAEHGEIVGLAAWYAGLGAALRRVAAAGAPLLNQVHDIMTMFDKRRCHTVLVAAGVPVPAALPDAGRYQQIRDQARAAGWPRVFVKPAHGSSGSGVIALAFGRAGRVSGYTAVERDRGRLFNALPVRRYDSEAEIAAIVDALAADGLDVERWLPKARFGGRVVDLRVVVIAGQPSHMVVRASRSPVNAFGDLLPGLVVGGRDTYTEQVDALLSGRFAAWSTAEDAA